MVAFKFPMSSGKFIGEVTEEQLIELCKDHCCMFRVEIEDLVPTNDIENPISSSKCRELKEAVKDNGRVVTASHLVTTITEQDYFTYKHFYDWSSCKIFDLVAYKKGYLPTRFIEAVLKLYVDKTELKGVDGQELNYLLAKEMLNSTYGMTVTDIVREILEYDGENYHSNYDNMSEKEYKEFLETQIRRYNDNPYRFLFYPWGVWITAYARANLFSGIISCGRDYIYSDTDSIKITNPEKHEDYIKRYNENITQCLKEACEFHGIDFSMTCPKSKDGKEHPLGVWDFEGVYDEFKTLGAKRYLWRKGKKWNLTVAGVNKTMACNYLIKKTHDVNRRRKHVGIKERVSPFDFFNMDLVVPKDQSGRNVLTYIDDETDGYVTDYLGNRGYFHELSAIHMESSEYSFNPYDAFIEYLFTIKEEMW